MRLQDFRVLTFDCYGTLIDWEAGILAALQPLLGRTGGAVTPQAALEAFGRHEAAQEAATPAKPYPGILAAVHRRLAEEWNVAASEAEHQAFGASVPDWPAFPDSPEALAYLKRHFKLVILSNVDRASFAGSRTRLGVEFDLVCTAQDIGSYKPAPANFRYLLDRLQALGHEPDEVLHVAQSLFHDHVPARRAGLASAWIDRRHGQEGWGATPAPAEQAVYDFRFTSLEELAAAHRAGG
jgi:2-haloalkanoic acid dehalogenase type II